MRAGGPGIELGPNVQLGRLLRLRLLHLRHVLNPLEGGDRLRSDRPELYGCAQRGFVDLAE